MYFAVTRERGPAWDKSRAMHEQDEWATHAAFMNDLVREGFVIVGGPLDVGDKILLVVEAEDENAIRARFDSDPWTPMRLLSVTSIDAWHIRLGALPMG